MNLSPFFKSVIEQDKCSVVICNTEHEVIYMNPAAIANYAKRGGANIIGKSIFDCHNAESKAIIERVVAWFGASESNNIIHTYFNEKQNKDVYMVALRDDDKKLIGYYEKHEFRTRDNSQFYNMI